MRSIVLPNGRGGCRRNPFPFTPAPVRPVVVTARRDQFGGVELRQVGGAK